MNWLWNIFEEKTLEAKVFLKHRKMFEASIEDFSCVLTNLSERKLITENQAKKIQSIKIECKNKRELNG